MRLDERLEAFNKRRRALLDEMGALDPATLVARPLAGKWSILEIIEHLVLAERAVLQGLPEPSGLRERQRRLKHRFSYVIVMFVLKYGIPVQVPSPAMIPQGDRSLGELRRLWDENQEWLRAYIDRLDRQGFRRAVFEHPIAGPLGVEQALHMGQVHLDTHVRQIRRLQRLTAQTAMGNNYWAIGEGPVNSARFFEALWRHFPGATTFYAEGCAIAPEVKACFIAHQEEGKYLPRAQTIFPRSAKFRCRFSAELTAALSALAEAHAEPELLHHLALYRGSVELLFWHDAFGNVLLVSREVPENVVSAFAKELGLSYSEG